MCSLEKVAGNIVQKVASRVETPLLYFSCAYDVKRELAGGVTMAFLSALGGASVGIAAIGYGISGAWVLVPVLGLVGLLAGRPGEKT